VSSYNGLEVILIENVYSSGEFCYVYGSFNSCDVQKKYMNLIRYYFMYSWMWNKGFCFGQRYHVSL